MLSIVEDKLASLYAGEEQIGVDGATHKIDKITKISALQGHKLVELHEAIKPKISLEVGMAYGFSTLYFLDAMARGGYGSKHIAVDPFQFTGRWAGIGVKSVEQVGLNEKFEFIEDRSDFALSSLAKKGELVQFVYIDGSHLFEDALSDFCLSDKILEKGGVIVLDDLWMPALKKVASFIEKNRYDTFRRMSINFENIAAYEKIAQKDSRDWEHYEDF